MKKKIIMRVILLLIIMLLTSITSVYAVLAIESSSVSYDNTTSGLQNTVQGAIDTLYTRQKVEMDEWKNKYYELVKNSENVALVDYVLSLPEDNTTVLQDDGTDDHNMRYIGATPNNYVTINGSEWRIIGVFDSNSHGINKKLIKIQFTQSIGAITWDENGSCDWNTASLKDYLNTGTYYTTTIESAMKPMIQEVYWKLGSISWDTNGKVEAKKIYNEERGNIGPKTSRDSVEWFGNIALAHPSDYLLSTAGGTTYSREECLTGKIRLSTGNYNDLWSTSYSQPGECVTTSWITLQGNSKRKHQWTLNTRNDVGAINGVFQGDATGIFHLPAPIDNNRNYNVYPTLYLKSNVICTNCSEADAGSSTNPFQLSYTEE